MNGTDWPVAFLYHATPLHYLPHIASTGALLAKSVTAGSAIRPRSSACRRDRMLALENYVHFYARSQSPLLADKIGKGYPHAILVFEARPILEQAGTAVILYNTKSWRHREDFQPIVDRMELERALAEHVGGAHPSLEVLARYAVGLEYLREIAFIDDPERRIASATLRKLGLTGPARLAVARHLFPITADYRPTSDPVFEYLRQCRHAAALMPPPCLPFD